MQALLINVLSPPSKVLNDGNFEAFFTSLSLMKKAKEIATNLANKLFSHSLISIGNILCNHINSANATYNTIDIKSFTYIAINRYLFDKFYEIMIDISAFKYSTAGYGQFKAYIKDIKYTTIDISKAGAIYIEFGIDSISSMGSVFIQTLIRHIEFHIVKANTLFLLYFVDIDRLSVYYSNIIKLLVMKSTCIPVICHFDHPFLLWESSLNSYIT